MDPFDPKPLTPRQREHHHYLIEAMTRLEWDLQNRIYLERRIPREWHRLSAERDHAKERLTVRFDRDVVRFFRSMGPGYQPRMNAVLRAFMHAKLMGVLKGDDTVDKFRDQEDYGRPERPGWGHLEEDWARAEALRGKRGE